MYVTGANSRGRNFLAAVAVVAALWAPGATAAQRELGAPRGRGESTTGKAALQKDRNMVKVECSNPVARVRSIAAGLNQLGDERPATLLISGTCHENVSIATLDHVTLQGNPTATIDGGSDPSMGAVEIADAQDITLSNLTITGGGEGVGCFGQSYCNLLQVTIENSLGDGVGVGVRCHLNLVDSVVQNNAGPGISQGAGSVNFFGGLIANNSGDGISMRNGSYLGVSAGTVYPAATIQGNAGNGITAQSHSTLALAATITGNGGDGVTLQGGSEMTTNGSSIANNGGHQVRIGDLSFVRFAGFHSNTIFGANAPDVVCDPQFSATRQFSNLTGTTTNCPAELPPTP